MNSLILKYYKSKMISRLISTGIFIGYSLIGLLVLFSFVIVFHINVDELLMSDLFIKVFLVVFGSVLAYFTFIIQRTKSKNDQTSETFYKNILVPVYLQIEKDKIDIENYNFVGIERRVYDSISEIDLNHFIPKYLEEAIKLYEKIIENIIEMKNRLYEQFDKNAFMPKNTSEFGIEGSSPSDTVASALKNDIAYYYCINHETVNRDEQIKLNSILITYVKGTPEYTNFITNYVKLQKIRNDFQNYLVFVMRKIRDRIF